MSKPGLMFDVGHAEQARGFLEEITLFVGILCAAHEAHRVSAVDGHRSVATDLRDEPWGALDPITGHEIPIVGELVTGSRTCVVAYPAGPRARITEPGDGAFTRQSSNLFSVVGTVNPGKAVADLETAIDAEIERVKAGPIADWEMEKARNNARSQLVNSLGSALDRAVTLGEDALFYNNPDRINTRADSIAKVTAADVQRVAKQYLVKTGRTVVITVPKAAAGAPGAAPKGGL